MQHKTKTLGLVLTAMTAGVVALVAVRSVRSEPQTAPSPPQSREITKKVNEKFQKEFEEASKRESIANKKAQQLFEEGRLAEAEQACYDALAVSFKINGETTDIDAQQLLGDVYREQGRYKEAIEMYQTSLKHGAGDEAVDFKTALCYLKLGDLKNAHKFYSEEKFVADVPAKKKADYLSMLPGTKTPRTMEASLLYAMGCVKRSQDDEKAIALWKKVLEIVPQNALAAHNIAWEYDFLGKRDEAVPYWARAAVFGKGYIADDGHRELNNHLMPDKIEQALRDARKIG